MSPDQQTLYVLSRGRVRDVGGTDVGVIDHAGTLWSLRPDLASPLTAPMTPDAFANAEPLAVPTEPPFKLLDRSLPTALDDHNTDRPYCGLAYDARRNRFYLCAFSGIDKPLNAEGGYFRKNRTDAILAYDANSNTWEEVWRGAPLDGPDNCLVVNDTLYVVTKDSSRLLAFDARKKGRQAPRYVAHDLFNVQGLGLAKFGGHSMLAHRGDGYLYLGFRTSSTIIRIPESELGKPIPKAELLARFTPFDPVTRKTADLTDMSFGPDGALYVISAKPARVYRIVPDPGNVFDARDSVANPASAWADLSILTGNPRMKSENVFVDARNRVYVTSADLPPSPPSPTLSTTSASQTPGTAGVIYRIDP